MIALMSPSQPQEPVLVGPTVVMNQNVDENSAFYANNDASSYNARYLKSIRNKERFQELHFYQCDEELIDELIPKKPGKGALFPPPMYRQSASTLHQWRDLNEADQLLVIEQEKLKAASATMGSAAGVSTGSVAVAAAAPVAAAAAAPVAVVSVAAAAPVAAAAAAPPAAAAAAPPPPVAQVDLKRDLGTVEGSRHPAEVSTAGAHHASAPPAKVAKTGPAEEEDSPGRWQGQQRAPIADFPTRWGIASKDVNIDFRKDRVCRGITLGLLRRTYPNETEKLTSFGVLVGEAMKHKVKVYSNNLSWPFSCDPRLVGCIVNYEGTSEVVLTWICVQLMDDKDGEPVRNESKLDGIHFYHPTCDRASPSLLCENCKTHVNEFVTLCGAYCQR